MRGVLASRTACRPHRAALYYTASLCGSVCRSSRSSQPLQRRSSVAVVAAFSLSSRTRTTARGLHVVGSGNKPPAERSFDPSDLGGVDDEPKIDALLFEEDEVVTAERAAEMAVLYVAAAFAFGLGVWATMGGDKASEFFAGYLLEQSLSVDNLFVFILVFKYFRTPVDAQRTCLFWGILTAAVLRLMMILLGVELITRFEPLLLVFAAILIFSSYKLIAGGDDDEDEDLSDNAVVKLCRRIIKVAPNYDGDKFLTYENGVRIFTPLALVLTVIELSDVIFAVDSIPAVFGVTTDPFIIYTSNIFAIISLRGFYSFIAVFMGQLRFLDKAVALVLGFIGIKMVVETFGYDLPTWIALLVVAGVLGAGVGLSFAFPKTEADGDEEDNQSGGSVEGQEHTALISERAGQQTAASQGGEERGEELLVLVSEEAASDKKAAVSAEENGHQDPTDSMDRDDVVASQPVNRN